MKAIVKIVLYMLAPIITNLQNSNADSLQRNLNRYQKEDNISLKKLHDLAIAIPNNQNEKAEAIYFQAEKLAVKIVWKKEEANSLKLI